MKSDSLQFQTPDPRTQSTELFDLIAKVFSDAGYYYFRNHCRDAYINNSHYDWDASLIGMMDGRIVTHYGVWGYDMRIGRAVVRCGGIGAVATDGDYRKRGLMAKTIPPALDLMRERGYDMTILFGISNFYHKFGYVRAWSRQRDEIGVHNLPIERPAVKPRRFRDYTREDLAKLYAKTHADFTGTAIRPTYLSDKRARPEWFGLWWPDARGKMAGYVLCGGRSDALECYEVAGDPRQALLVLADATRKLGRKALQFVDVHEHHPIIRMVRRGDCTTMKFGRRSGGPMVRTLNLGSTLTKMVGELSRRVKASNMVEWRGSLLVADPRERVCLDINRGKVKVGPVKKTKHALMGGEEVAQLLIGTNDVEETIEAGSMRLSGDAAKLAPVLFPNEHPMLCPWDGY